MIRRLVFTLLAGVFAGCASAPPPSVPAVDLDIAGRWSAVDPLLSGATADSLQEDWWKEIGGKPLDALVREALDANYSLAVATANVDAARAAIGIAGADRLPQIQAGGSARRNSTALIGIPIRPGTDLLRVNSTSFGAELSADWELDLWNRLGKLEQSALADYQASEADLAGARLSLASQVTRAWLNLIELHAQQSLAEEAFDTFSETAETAWSRYQRGLISAVDVHLTRASRESAGALLAQRGNQVAVARRQLELLLGRYPGAEIEAPASLPAPPPLPPVGLPSELLLRRPDLLAAERRMVAGSARTSAARRSFLPGISLTASTGLSSTALKDLLKGDFSVWSIAGSILQPVFQGGRLRARVRQGEAVEGALINAWANQALGAFTEVENALSAESWLRDREDHLRKASESARAGRELSEDRYRQGVGSLFDVLESQRRALDAESQWLSARNARLQARVDLFLALGGGFDTAGPDAEDMPQAPQPAPAQADPELSRNK